MAEVTAAKKSLRAQIKDKLSSLEQDAVSRQSQHAQETILSLPQYSQAKALSVYLSMPSGEAGTDLIVRDALQSGKQVFVPHLYKVRVDDNNKPLKFMDMLRLNSIEDYQSLAKDSWGIPTLPKASIATRQNVMGGQGLTDGSATKQLDETQLDLIVMPAMAYDSKCQRLGHGAGYYDSFLSRYVTDIIRNKPLLVGLCLAEQLVDAVPVTERDWLVDMVVTGDQKLVRRTGSV